MASINNSKIFDVTMSGNSTYHLELKVTENNYEIVTNTSSGTWTLRAYRTSSSSTGSYNLIDSTASVTLNDTTLFNGRVNFDFRNYVTSQTLASGTFSVQHNDDGTKTMSVRAAFDSGVAMDTGTINSIMELVTIPRASKFNTQATQYISTLSSTISVDFTQYVSEYTQNLIIDYGSSSTINRNNIQVGDNIIFTTTEINNMFSTIDSASSIINGTVTLTTYDEDNNIIGTDTINIWWQMKEDSSTQPTMSGTVTITEQNSEVYNLTSGLNFIQDYSNTLVKFTGSSTDPYNATISKYLSNTNEMTVTSTGAELLYTNINTTSYTVKAQNSRGFNSNTINVIIPLITDYVVPQISNPSIARESGVGEKTYLSFNAKLWNGNFGNGNNKVTLFKYRVKKTTDNDYLKSNGEYVWYDATTRFNNAISGQSVDNITVSSFRLYSDGSSKDFDIGIGYDIQFYIMDGITNITTSTTYNFNSSGYESVVLDDGLILDSYNKTSTGYQYGINQIVDTDLDDGLQINGKLYLNGDELDLDTIVETLENLQPQAITITSNASQSIGTTWVEFNFPVLKSQVGSELTQSGNSIIVGSGIKYVEVSAQLHGLSPSRFWFTIYHEDSSGNLIDKQDCLGYSGGNEFAHWSFAPKVIAVSKGDKFYIKGGTTSGTATFNTSVSNLYSSYMTIKKVS